MASYENNASFFSIKIRRFFMEAYNNWNGNKPVSLLAFNNNTTKQIRMKIYCSWRAWY